MPRTRRKIDARLKVELALEGLRGQSSIAELAKKYELHPNQIYAWMKRLQDYAIFAFERRNRRDIEGEVEKLHAKIGQLTMERDSLRRKRHRRIQPR